MKKIIIALASSVILFASCTKEKNRNPITAAPQQVETNPNGRH